MDGGPAGVRGGHVGLCGGGWGEGEAGGGGGGESGGFRAKVGAALNVDGGGGGKAQGLEVVSKVVQRWRR